MKRGTPNTYTVTWKIGEIDCESPLDAARFARESQLDPNSLATEFKVIHFDEAGFEDGKWYIDLQIPEGGMDK